jgi:hypothetical protein
MTRGFLSHGSMERILSFYWTLLPMQDMHIFGLPVCIRMGSHKSMA